MTRQMILTTAGNEAKSAMSVRLAKVENVKRASEKRIATGNILILQRILQIAGNAVLLAPRA